MIFKLPIASTYSAGLAIITLVLLSSSPINFKQYICGIITLLFNCHVRLYTITRVVVYGKYNTYTNILQSFSLVIYESYKRAYNKIASVT